MNWQMVAIEDDSFKVVRGNGTPLTSPKFEDLSERAQDQVKYVSKVIKGLLKAGAVGEGKVRINASGYAHHDPEKMSTDQKDFIALSIGRTG